MGPYYSDLTHYMPSYYGNYTPYGGMPDYVDDSVLGSIGQGASGLASGMMSGIGGGLFNLGSQVLGMAIQNGSQRRMYRDMNSPQARMRDMQQAGINPAAAAQGISQSSAPQMNAASPGSGAAPGLSAEAAQLPNQSKLADANANQLNTQAGLNDAMTVGQGITNFYSGAQYEAEISKLVAEGLLTRYQATQLAPYAQNAYELFALDKDTRNQTLTNMKKEWDKMSAEITLDEAQTGFNQAETRRMNFITTYMQKYGIEPGTPLARYVELNAKVIDPDISEEERAAAQKQLDDFTESVDKFNANVSFNTALGEAAVTDPQGVQTGLITKDFLDGQRPSEKRKRLAAFDAEIVKLEEAISVLEEQGASESVSSKVKSRFKPSNPNDVSGQLIYFFAKHSPFSKDYELDLLKSELDDLKKMRSDFVSGNPSAFIDAYKSYNSTHGNDSYGRRILYKLIPNTFIGYGINTNFSVNSSNSNSKKPISNNKTASTIVHPGVSPIFMAYGTKL